MIHRNRPPVSSKGTSTNPVTKVSSAKTATVKGSTVKSNKATAKTGDDANMLVLTSITPIVALLLAAAARRKTTEIRRGSKSHMAS